MIRYSNIMADDLFSLDKEGLAPNGADMTDGGTKEEGHILAALTLSFFLVFSVTMFDFSRDFFGALAADKPQTISIFLGGEGTWLGTSTISTIGTERVADSERSLISSLFSTVRSIEVSVTFMLTGINGQSEFGTALASGLNVQTGSTMVDDPHA